MKPRSLVDDDDNDNGDNNNNNNNNNYYYLTYLFNIPSNTTMFAGPSGRAV